MDHALQLRGLAKTPSASAVKDVNFFQQSGETGAATSTFERNILKHSEQHELFLKNGVRDLKYQSQAPSALANHAKLLQLAQEKGMNELSGYEIEIAAQKERFAQQLENRNQMLKEAKLSKRA